MAGNEQEAVEDIMTEFDFAELKDDLKFLTTAKEFDEQIKTIEKQIDQALKLREDSRLSLEDTIKLDNCLALAVNSLYWSYLKMQGADHKIPFASGEITRTRKTIMRDNEIDAYDEAPRLDVAAARRFIGHGTHTRFEDTDEPPLKVNKLENPEGKTSLQEKLIEQRKQALAQMPPPPLP